MDMQLHDQNILIKGVLTLEFRNVKTGKIRRYTTHNMFVLYGKNAIAQRLSGQASVGDITYCAAGTGSTAPDQSDTALETEIFRKLISVRSYSGNVATFQIFFTTSEANGSLAELGLFGNGVGRTASGTPGSGQLFCRSAISRTKTSNDTLSISWALTIA